MLPSTAAGSVKLTGDGLLCEFTSVVDAVACAVAIQQGMAGRERDVPVAERIRFHIGVNLGDIIVEGEDIYGDGVNIAARLEGLADPGGVCVSGKVREERRKRLDLAFAPMSPQRVKSIAESVETWRVVLDGRAPVARKILLCRPGRVRAAVAAALALLVVSVAAVGASWWLERGALAGAGGPPLGTRARAEPQPARVLQQVGTQLPIALGTERAKEGVELNRHALRLDLR